MLWYGHEWGLELIFRKIQSVVTNFSALALLGDIALILFSNFSFCISCEFYPKIMINSHMIDVMSNFLGRIIGMT